MVEVESDSAEGDRYRMLLQAACMARLGRQMFKQPFIVFALYIENSGLVTRYLVFQSNGDGNKVCASESEQSRFFFLTGSRFSMSPTSRTGRNRSSCLKL
jgi:hypothetical protein